MPWADRVESLLYDGETCERRFDLGSESQPQSQNQSRSQSQPQSQRQSRPQLHSRSASPTLVVTSHRVLAFTPESDGADFHQLDRPNVTGVRITTIGRFAHCRRAIAYGLVGVGLLALSAAVSFDSLVPSLETAGVDSSTPGTGGITDAVTQVETLLSVLDALALVGGLLITTAALAFVGLYLRSRRRTLVLEVAGGDDVDIPIDGSEPPVTDLERAIRPGPVEEAPSATEFGF